MFDIGIFSSIFKKGENKQSIDSDSLYNYSIHAAVFIYDETEHRRIALIGSGTASVLKISRYVDSGAKGSLSFKKLDQWSLSYQINFSTNKDLLHFVDEYFPNSITGDIRKKIKRGIKFSVESYDDN